MATTNKTYLDIDGLNHLVGKYITGKTGSTYDVAQNVLATKIDFIELSTVEDQTLIYGYTSLSTQVILSSITITGALKDTYLSTSKCGISTDGKLSLYVQTNSGDSQLVINENDDDNRSALDLKAFINPDVYISAETMSSNYITPSKMDRDYLVITNNPTNNQTSAPNTLISKTDMDNMTITTSQVEALFA
jgi:hypothetical protein